MPHSRETQRKTTPSIMETANPYREVYGEECSETEWADADISIRMNFAAVYGMLTPRQAAAVEAALERNSSSDDPLPPVGVGFLADALFADSSFRSELTE